MTTTDSTRQRIQSLISENKVVLFMKGNAQMPQCGFSARAIQTLQAMEVAFTTVDVLQDPEIRQGIKDFSEWPTIPQLYVDQEFIGGSDIVSQMAASGELHEVLGVTYESPTPPTLHLSDAFVAEVRRFQSEGAQGFLRLQVSPNWDVGIGFSEKESTDLEVVSGGLTVLVDPGTAKRSEGVRLDFQGGVIVDNPNAPPVVNRLPAQGLKQLMDAGRELHVFDVRTPEEWAIAQLPGAVLLDDAGHKALQALPEDAMIVFVCHHGVRSMSAASQLVSAGYRNVFNLEGGIEAWSTQVDPSVPRY